MFKLARNLGGLVLVASLAISTPRAAAADPTDRVRQILEDGSTGGTVGLYLRHIGGATLGAFNEGFVFEPASTIKALIHFHAMKQVELGPVTLGTQVPWLADMTKFDANGNYVPGGNDCPADNTVPESDPLSFVLNLMMVPSDNAATQALRDYFGDGNIDATRQTFVMNDTAINHMLGCGADAVANHNQLTLVDAGKMYEASATGFLQADIRAQAFSLMIRDTASFEAIVDAEAAGLGLSAAAIDDFKSHRDSALKAGSYGLSDGQYQSVAGWAMLPYKDVTCASAPRQYVFGAFIDAASDISQSFSIRGTGVELFREQIRAALESWAACEADLVVTKTDSPDPILAGTNMVYTVKVTNTGPGDALSVTLKDKLPSETVFVSNVAAVGWNCVNPPAGQTGTITCTTASLPAGAAATFIIEARVSCDVVNGTNIINSATASSVTLDRVAANNTTATSTIVSNPPPIVNATVATDTLSPPNHDLVNVGLTAIASDGACPAPTSFAVSVFSDEDDQSANEPANSPDAKDIGVSALRLRAERSSSGDGRVYLVVVKATDSGGATGFSTVTVVVPQNQSAGSQAAVEAEAAAAKTSADANSGNPPPGYVVVGDGPVLGPKQ